MIIKELKQPINNYEMITDIKNGKLKMKNECMIIHFNTGFHWLNSMLVEGSQYSDIQAIIEYLAMDYQDLFSKYNWENVEEYGEHWQDIYMPINGGKFFIDNISHIDFID